MDKASQDALEVAKIAAMISGQLKQVDQNTNSPVTNDKHASNRINPEMVYHQQKQRFQQTAPAAPNPPPVAVPPQPQPAPASPPVTVAAAPPVMMPAPQPVTVSPPSQNNDELIKALTDLTKKLSSFTTSINKLIKAQNPKS